MSDSIGIAGRIHDRLAKHFGRDSVLLLELDEADRETNQRKLAERENAVSQAQVVLVTVGRQWLSGMEDAGDPVRAVVRMALQSRVPVIPILVNDARMPSSDELPGELKDLAFRNAADVDPGRDFDHHVDRLVRSVSAVLTRQSRQNVEPVQAFGAPPPREASPPARAPVEPRPPTGAPIFISHSSQDRKFAETICRALESRGQSCWLATRDVKGGANYQEAIVEAIGNAKAMVLVFSANANNSDEIKKEVSLASQYKLMVIPVRLEDVKPSGAFAYELVTRQWIDFFDNWERAIDDLSARIAGI